MKTRIKPALRCTKEYDLFTLHEQNRDFNENKALAESMRKYGFLSSHPVHVNENMEIIDGHHRFVEAKRQDLPIWYIKESTEVPLLDLQLPDKKWNNMDYATAYAKQGKQDYIELLAFAKKHKISIVTASSLLHGENPNSGNKNASIPSGNFTVKNRKYAHDVMRIVEMLVSFGIEFALQRAFIGAIGAIIRLEEFDTERFIARARLYPKHMTHRAAKYEYMEEIESLYNYTTRDKVPIAFLGRQSEMMRNPISPKKK